jgi:8-oxo-dGTP diphosphatase
MKAAAEINEFIKNGHKLFLPNINIDCAIFGYHEHQLKILLAKWKGIDGYSLPGGFVGRKEPLSMAANRILKEKTSLDNVYLQQFHTFGDSEFRTENHKYAMLPKGNWLRERSLTIGYYALVNYSRITVEEDILTEKYVWQDTKKIPTLLFDHNEVLDNALHHMRINLYHQPIGYNLLEMKFTMREIQSLYEVILGKKLDRRNFPKKLMALGLIKHTNEVRKIGQHRSPKLYSFDKKKYDKSLKEGIVLAF